MRGLGGLVVGMVVSYLVRGKAVLVGAADRAVAAAGYAGYALSLSLSNLQTDK
jgi:hypothetical protein